MGRPFARLAAFLLFFTACFGLGAEEAQASGFAGGKCHRYEQSSTSFEEVRADKAGWICDADNWRDDGSGATWVRFFVSQDSPPQYLRLMLARFEAVTVYSVESNDVIASRHVASDEIVPLGLGSYALVEIPQTRTPPHAVYVRIKQPLLPSTGAGTALFEREADAAWPLYLTVVMAVLFGLILTPLLFDLTLYPVMRHRFMLWHALMTSGMLVAMAAASGLLTTIMSATITQLVTAYEFGYAIIIGAAGFFAINFIEPEALTRWNRIALRIAATIAFVLCGGIALQLPMFRNLDFQLYLLGFVPMLLATIAAVTIALIRNSVWVRYQIVGWTPAMLVGVDMGSAAAGFQAAPTFGHASQFLAMGFEILITGVGVIHRLLLLRRQRDDALAEARMMETLSERDPLTGLHNRRSIDARFEDLHRAGYETFALLDLDNFKQVNDSAGHATGDDVLRVTASVLKNDDNSIAMRLGGEEFLMLMRGQDAVARAEKLRQAIPVRIAREVVGLDQIVTASMGMVVVPRGALPKAVFSDIYSHADRLLYEAKDQGRNRTVSEKLRGFRRRKQDRRKTAA